MTAPVLAHAGHWAIQIAYLAPLVILIVAMVVGRVRERREERSGPEGRD